jgi:aspartyl-tRNA synthetase
MLKTHNCGELRSEHAGQQVTLAGWVHRWRDQGGLIFWDLRDRWGITQVTINQQTAPEVHAAGKDVRAEWVVQVTGTVIRRPAGMENPELSTGDIEVEVSALTIMNQAKTPPFYINKEDKVEELLRMRYRYLDLRRPRMQRNLVLRHNAIRFIRNYLADRGFVEIETPISCPAASTPANSTLCPRVRSSLSSF